MSRTLSTRTGRTGIYWAWLLLPAVLAVGCHTLGIGMRLRRVPGEILAESEAHSLLVFLGMVTFALTIVFGFLLSQAAELRTALQLLALPLAVAGVPILSAGLLLQRRLGEESPALAGLRTTATGVALGGLLVLLGAITLAWPHPGLLLLVCAADYAVLTTLAFRQRMPLAHFAAFPCLLLTWLTAFHLAAGNLSLTGLEDGAVLARLLISRASGAALAPLVMLLAAVGEFLVRRQPDCFEHARFHLLGAAFLAVPSLWLVGQAGLDVPGRAALVYGLLGVTGLLANVRWRWLGLSYAGQLLLLAATLWGLQEIRPARPPLWGIVMALETLALAWLAVWRRDERLETETAAPWQTLTAPCHNLAWATMVVALVCVFSAPALRTGPGHVLTALILAGAALLLTWASGMAVGTFIGAVLVWAGLTHLLVWDLPAGLIPRPWLAALLAHATLALVVRLLLPRDVVSEAMDDPAGEAVRQRRWRLEHLYGQPLGVVVFFSSLLAVPVLLPGAWGDELALAGYASWLGALWLVLSWVERTPSVFTGAQAAFSAAALLAATAWVEAQSWGSVPADLADPRTLQAFGVALGLLGLVWVSLRLALVNNERAQALRTPPWPAWDRVVLGLVVVGSLVLAISGVLPAVLDELIPANMRSVTGAGEALGVGGWLLLGVLTITVIVSLWDRPALAVPGLVVLGLTLPVLGAGQWDADLSAATALRWGLGLLLLVGSVPLWLRDPVSRLAPRARVSTETSLPVARITRGILVVCTVLPILLVTAAVASLGFSGQSPAGPVAGSLFARLGWVPANVVLLVLVCVALVGHALREESAAYAFAAGLVANMALTGGYALAVVTGGGIVDEALALRVLQLGSLGAGVWALGWLLVRPWSGVWGENVQGRPLMLTQMGLALGGVGCVLVPALVVLVQAGPLTITSPMVLDAGSLLGWAALVACLASPVLRHSQLGQWPSWHAVGLATVAVAVSLACTLEVSLAGWGYRTLTLALAAQALLWSLGQFLPRRFSLEPETAGGWVAGLGVVTVLLALKASLVHGDWLVASIAVAGSSVAGAFTAVWQRREGWAFLSGLGVNLAVSLAVCHFHDGQFTPGLWVVLAQANVLVSAAVALLWFLADQRFALRETWHREPIPLLGLQSFTGLTLNVFLLLVSPLVLIALTPAKLLPSPLERVADPTGWAAWLLASAAGLCYCVWRDHRLFVSVLGVVGVSAAGLGAVLADRSGIAWLSHHILVDGVAVLASAAVLLAVLLRPRGAEESEPDVRARLWSASHLQGWAVGLGLVLVLLGLRAGWEDPARPYYSAGAVALAAMLAGALALGLRRAEQVTFSGGLLVLAGVLAWVPWGPDTLDSLASTVAVCLAVGSIAWTLADLGLPGSVPVLEVDGRPVAFQYLARRLALGLVSVVIGAGVISLLSGDTFRATHPLTWLALGGTVTALVVGLWDARTRDAVVGLYSAGLLGLVLCLQAFSLTPAQSGRAATLGLAAHLALAAAIAWTVPRLAGLLRLLRLPAHHYEELPRPWFPLTQVNLAGVVVALSLWASLSFAPLLERLAGPVSILLLLPTCFFLADRVAASWTAVIRLSVLDLVALGCVETAWAWLEPGAAGWLHHSAASLIVLVLLGVVYRDGLTALLSQGSPWQEAARRLGNVLAILAVLALPVLLAQEFGAYDKVSKQTPLGPIEVWLAAAAILGLMVLALRAALAPSEGTAGEETPAGWRTRLVYGSELLLLMLFVHLKLNAPWMFGLLGVKYWPLIVMALAYVSVGLGEFFQRRRLLVLAGPLERTGLFLPLLPLLIFWLRPSGALVEAVEGIAPGMTPMLSYLRNLPANYQQHALLWFVFSVLYLLVGVSRRSFRHTLLAALAANFGLWALLAHFEVGFLLHPQAWLIPLALIVLVSEHLNRDRLSHEQSVGLRYVGLSMIYVSSTADLFIAGVGRSLILPVVLAVLAVLGVLAGILLRVRAFLFMGLTFLCLDIFTMIWHAAVDRTQTWVWYVSGIVLGSAILALFALFEKRRNDVLRLLEEIKRWDSVDSGFPVRGGLS